MLLASYFSYLKLGNFDGVWAMLFCFNFQFGHLSIFHTFILSFFNIAIYLLAVITIQEKHLQELRVFIPNKISFCVFSQCRSKTFLMDGKHECAYS
jgi:hypothetical protein